MRETVGRWGKDLAFGLRLAVGGSRSSKAAWMRLVLGAFGIGLVVAVLLGAASAGTVLEERSARADGMNVVDTPREGVDPLLVRNVWTEFRDGSIDGRLIHATGRASPMPPGVDRWLKAGEMLVSPELAALLDSAEGELLRPRFAEFRIVGTLSKPGLVQPNDLTFVAATTKAGVWAAADEHDPPQEAYSFGRHYPRDVMAFVLVVLVLLAATMLLIPMLIFVLASSRVAGEERDRRLAALRLVGGDAAQVRRIAAGETLASSLLGQVLGVALFFALRPLVGQVRIFDAAIFADDIVPAWELVPVIFLGVPLLSVGAAVLALRRTVVEPLGVVRQGNPIRRRLWWRLATFIAGVVLLSSGLANERSGDLAMGIGIVGGGALIVLGIAMLLPWCIEALLRRVRGGTPALQLAVRRLQVDNGAASRVVSGIVVVLAGAVALLSALAATEVDIQQKATENVPYDIHRGELSVHFWTNGTSEAEAVASIEATPAVRAAHVQRLAVFSSGQERLAHATIGDCFVIRKLATVDDCADGDVFVYSGHPLPDDLVKYAKQIYVPVPGERIRFDDVMGAAGESRQGVKWTIPADARVVQATHGAWEAGVLLTPAAVPEGVIAESFSVVLEPEDASVKLADLVEGVRNQLGITTSVHIGGDFYGSNQEREFETVRTTIYAGAVAVLVIAALSVLVLAVEQVRERRRALSAVAASGVGFGTLARSLLWQNAIPLAVGAVLAVLGGILLAYLVLKIPDLPLAIDWTAIAAVVGVAAGLGLLVTLLSLPVLRSAVSVKNLRTE